MENRTYLLKLKIVWFKNFLGLAVEQVILNQHYSLTPYYFWPKTEAWEQLKLELDSKLWLTQEEKVKILKVIGDVMNYWLSYRSTKTVKDLLENLPQTEHTL